MREGGTIVELRQLEHFVAVAEFGVFARAAVHCRIAPSALSASIRSLERDLETELFFRTTRRVELTEAGLALIPRARRTLAAAAEARAAVDDVRALVRGSLTVGGVPTAGLLDQPALLGAFATKFPDVELSYMRDTSDVLLERLREGRLDIAFVSLPASLPTDLVVHQLAQGQVFLACRPDHRLAGRGSVSCRDVVAERLVTTGQPGSRGQDYLDQIFTASGVAPSRAHEVQDVPTMLDFVERGLGVALVVDAMVRNRPGLRTLEIEDPSLTWVLGAVTPQAVTPAVRELVALLKCPDWRRGRQ